MSDTLPTTLTSTSTSHAKESKNIRVLCRVRPSSDDEKSIASPACINVHRNTNTIELLSKPDSKLFSYDVVVDHTSTQHEIFTNAGKPITDTCLTGYNGTIFAYGQTGSGKTFTITGGNADQRGLLPRIFEYLFTQVQLKSNSTSGSNKKYSIKASYLEIYHEKVYDLLDVSTATAYNANYNAVNTGLQLREDSRNGVFVEGLIEENVQSVDDCMRLLQRGASNRRVAETAMNRESSRSHSVFCLNIHSTDVSNNVRVERSSRFNLVDLAGSERQKETKTTGQQLKEATHINKSLSALGNVILALVEQSKGKERHVAYRDSKLTYLLRDSLGGNTMTYLIACVSPSSLNFSETLSTLQFAQRAKSIKNNAMVNENKSVSVNSLQQEIQRLQMELAQYQQQQRLQPVPASATPQRTVQSTLMLPPHGLLSHRKTFASSTMYVTPSKRAQGVPPLGLITPMTVNKRIKREQDASDDEATSGTVNYEELHHQSVEREQAWLNSIQQLEHEVKQLQKINSSYQQQQQSDKSFIRSKEQLVSKLEAQLNTGSKVSIFAAESTLRTKIESLTKELDETKKTHEAQLQQQAAIQQQTIDKLQHRVLVLESAVQYQDANNGSTNINNTQIDNYTPHKQRKVQSYTQQHVHNYKLTKQLIGVEKRNRELLNELNSMQSRVQNPNEYIDMLATPQRSTLRNTILNPYRSEYQLEKKQYEQRISELEAQIEQQIKELNDAAENAAIDTKVRAELFSKITTNERNYKEMQQTRDMLISKHDIEVKRLIEKYENEIKEVKRLYETQLNEQSKASNEITANERKLHVEVQQFQQRYNILQDEHKELKQRYETIEAHSNAFKNKLEHIEEEQRSEAQKYHELQNEHTRLQHEYNENSNELNRVKQEYSHDKQFSENSQILLKGEMQEMYQQLQSKTSEYRLLEEQYVSLQTERSTLQQQVQQKQEEIDSQHFRLELLQEDHDEMVESDEYMRQSLATAQQQLCDLEKQLNTVKEQLSVANERLEAQINSNVEEELKHEISTLGNRCVVLEKLLEDANNESSITNNKNIELQTTVNDLTGINTELQQRLQQHQAQLVGMRQEVADLQSECDAFKLDKEELMATLSTTHAQLQATQQLNDEHHQQYNQQLDVLHDELRNKEKDTANAKDELRSYMERYGELEISYNTVASTSKQLEEHIEELQHSVTDLTQEVQQRDLIIQEVKQEKEQVEQSLAFINSLTSSLSSSKGADDNTAELNTEDISSLSPLQQRITQLIADKHQLQHQYNLLRQQLQRSEERIIELSNITQNMQHSKNMEISELQQAITALQSSTADASAIQAELDAVKEEYAIEKVKYEGDIVNLKHQITELEDLQSSLENEAKISSEDANKLSEERLSLREQLQDSLAERERFIGEMQRMNGQETALMEEYDRVLLERDGLRDELSKLQQHLTDTLSQQSALKDQVNNLIGHKNTHQKIKYLQDIKAENDTLQQDKVKLERELRKMRQKLLEAANNNSTNGTAISGIQHKASSTSTTRHTRSDSSSSAASHTSSLSDADILSIAREERAEDESQIQEFRRVQAVTQKLIDIILPMADKHDILDKENSKPGSASVSLSDSNLPSPDKHTHKRARRNTGGDKNVNQNGVDNSSLHQSVQQCIHIVQSLVSSIKSKDVHLTALKRQLKQTQRQLEVVEKKYALLEQQQRLYQEYSDVEGTINTATMRTENQFNLDEAEDDIRGM